MMNLLLLISDLIKKISLRIALTVIGILAVVGTFASPDQPPKKKQRIVFLISEDSLNYDAHKTIPVFAQMLGNKTKYDIKVLLGKGPNNAFSFPGLEILEKTDLVVLFSRRIALSKQQMNLFQSYLKNGGPLMAIRTGNHAFTARGQISEGYEDWPGFVTEILGCGNYGYGPVEPGTEVTIVPEQRTHPIISDLKTNAFHSTGNLYKVTPLTDNNAIILLNGTDGKDTQPVAWTRTAGKSKVFYTTLGYPTDFSTDFFNNLLINAIHWALH